MKKSGFTLIETIASIYIILIVFCIGITLCKFERNINCDIENSECIYEIQNLFSYGKAVCRSKNKYGEIIAEAKEKKIRFVEGWDNIEKIVKLPKNLELMSRDINIFITPEGKITRGYTINLYDNFGKIYEITIAVGADRIEIHSGDRK